MDRDLSVNGFSAAWAYTSKANYGILMKKLFKKCIYIYMTCSMHSSNTIISS